MSADKINKHAVNEVRKNLELEDEPSAPDVLLLGCGLQHFIRKVVREAAEIARREGSNVIQPLHIEAAKDSLMQDV